MQLALRPYVTAGVAIVGAGIIAATPITAAAPEIQNRSVTLSAAVQTLDLPSPADASPFASTLAESSFVDPIARWAEVFTLTATRMTELANAVMADPAPVLRQIIANQTGYAELVGNSLSTTAQNAINLVTIYMPDYLDAIRIQLEAGNIMAAGNELGNSLITIGATFFPMLDLLKIPNEIVGNLSAVLDEFAPKSFLDLGLVGQAGMGVLYAAVGYVKQGFTPIVKNLYDAVQTGDMVKFVSTIVNAPADTVSSILNGAYVPPSRPGRPGYWTEGLLTAKAWAPLHGILVDLPKAIATIIAPPAAPPAAPSTARLVAGTTSETTGSEVAGTDNALPAITEADETTGDSASPLAEKSESQLSPADTGAAVTGPEATLSETTTPVSSATEAAPAADESETPAGASEDPSTKPSKSLVRHSIVAVPGQTAADGKMVKPVKEAAEQVSATLDKIGQKVKKAFDKPAKKAAAADKDAGSKE